MKISFRCIPDSVSAVVIEWDLFPVGVEVEKLFQEIGVQQYVFSCESNVLIFIM